MTLRSSTSSLNSLGWFGSELLSSLEAKSMRPVGTQSRFTTPLTLLLNELFPPAKLAITVSRLGIAHSLSMSDADQRYLDWGVVTIKSMQRLSPSPLRRHSIRRTRRGARRQIVGCRFWSLRNRLKETLCADRSGQSRTWIKVKNPKAPAATRAIDGTF